MSLGLENINTKDVLDICINYFKHKCVLQASHKNQVELVSYSFHVVGDIPTGFLSHQAILSALCRRNAVNETATFFIKCLPRGASDKHSEYIKNFGAFEKEAELYAHVLPQIQHLAGVAFAPVCYTTKGSTVLVFENLVASGYSLASISPALGPCLLDLKHLIVCLDTVAALHASSIVYESKFHQSLADKYPSGIVENAYPATDANMTLRRQWVNNSVRVLGEMVVALPEYRERGNKIVQHLSAVVMKIFTFCRPSQEFRNVFSHGDLWANNVMFRYASFNDGGQRIDDVLPVESKLVDFQLARYAPPALDVLTLIANTTDTAFRAQHLTKLLDMYYCHFGSELKNHYLDVEIEYPRRKFDESCKHFYLAGLIESALFGHLILLPSDVTSSIVNTADGFEQFIDDSRTAMCMKAFETNEFYRLRMSGILREIIEQYVLPSL